MKKDVFLIVVILFAFFSLDSDLDSPITEPHSSTLRFAAVGDLWMSGYPDQWALPNLVKNFNVDLILFLGDSNYECGARDTFRKNLDAWGQLFINNPDAPLDMRFSHKSDAVPILAVMGNHEVWKEDYLKQSPCRYCQDSMISLFFTNSIKLNSLFLPKPSFISAFSAGVFPCNC